jgi:hypothetical protein
MTYETMARVQHGILTVRVWRSAPDFALGPDYDVQQTVLRSAFTGSPVKDAEAILHAVSAMDGVVCVEVVDTAGNGGLVWPGGGR